jgi:putative chitinase
MTEPLNSPATWKTKDSMMPNHNINTDIRKTETRTPMGMKDSQDLTLYCLNLCADSNSKLWPWKSHLIECVMSSIIPQLRDVAHIKSAISHFLGQCQHESGNFHYRTEVMNYSSKARILSVFSSQHFNRKGAKSAEECVGNPKDLANTVYANRLGNGHYASGDGYRYRGRGFIQLTGREMYQEFQNHLKEKKVSGDVLCHPQQVADLFPFLSAIFYFDKRSIWPNTLTVNDDNIRIVSTKINGNACLGLKDRAQKTYRFASLLQMDDA